MFSTQTPGIHRSRPEVAYRAPRKIGGVAAPPGSILDAEVARLEDGRFEVAWAYEAAAEDHQSAEAEVEVSWGSEPDGHDHGATVTRPASTGGAVLDIPADAPRPFVSLRIAGAPGVTIAGERRVRLDGPVNFRDLGGYRTTTGQAVKWGRLYRADALTLSDRDVSVFSGLGIRTVYDLRSSMEREANPSRLPDDPAPRVEAVPLVSEDQADNPILSIANESGEDFLQKLYTLMLDRSAPVVGRVLTGMADDEDLPAVFHCSAGKDRTGIISGVLMSILGVPREAILDDYEMTAQFRTAEHVRESMARLQEAGNLPPEVIAGILKSPRWAMKTALEHVDATYGGFDAYITGPAGADPSVPDRLRHHLLAP